MLTNRQFMYHEQNKVLIGYFERYLPNLYSLAVKNSTVGRTVRLTIYLSG
jgi:hypothetical protein